MLIFYDIALSPFAQKVKIALLEKAIDYETRVPDLGSDDAEFLAANPRGEVPALVDDGVAVFDSSIMLEYIEDKWPAPPLRAADPAGRARGRMIEEICDTRLEAAIWGLNEVLAFKRAEGALAQGIVAAAGTEIAEIRDWLAGQLGTAEWFGGAAPGIGDIAVFPYLNSADLFRFGPVAGSPLADWLQRMRGRASVQQTMAEAKAALPAFRETGARIMRGESRRQFRDHRLEFLIRAGGIDIVRDGLASGNVKFSALNA
jgi:glutathione S-transferase